MNPESWRDEVIQEFGLRVSETVQRPASTPSWVWVSQAKLAALDFLKTSDAYVEAHLHRFLESHPLCLPWATGDAQQGPHLYGNMLVSEPKITGDYDLRGPDFMWVSTSSFKTHIRLIEIERSRKRWFTGDGTPSADFTQAQNQLAQWRQLLEEEAGNDFIRAYDIGNMVTPQDKLRAPVFEYRLLYGRRSEFDPSGIHGIAGPRLNRRRSKLSREYEQYSTVDSIVETPTEITAETITVRRYANDSWAVVAVPPTFCTGPRSAYKYATMTGWKEAIGRLSDAATYGSAAVTAGRVSYLLDRYDYWVDEFTRRGENRWISGSHDTE